MISKQQWITALFIASFVTFGVAAMRIPENRPRNLKVLPKDISDRVLDSFMESYCKALNVGCDFCHVKPKNFPDSIDFVSDDHPMKLEARKMMRLTIQLNKDYFYFDT